MGIGERKAVRVPPEKAHGPRRQGLIVQIKKSDLPHNLHMSIGRQIEIRKPDGNLINTVITDIDEDTVTLAGNHPLPGKVIIFQIELTEII